jgi:hypothetical protein
MLQIQNRTVCLLAVPYILVVCCAAGCSTRSTKEFVPPKDRARKALDEALTAWQNGESDQITNVSPKVNAVDSRWKKGAKLAKYEVLSAEADPGGQSFSVKLTLQQPPGEKTIRYIVIGKDPLWVYSEEEYKAVSGQ